MAFDLGVDAITAAFGAQDAVAFPMAEHGAGVDFFGAVMDRDPVGDLRGVDPAAVAFAALVPAWGRYSCRRRCRFWLA